MNVTEIAGRTIAYAGMFALIVITGSVGKRYRRNTWQRRACQLGVALLTVVLVATLTLH